MKEGLEIVRVVESLLDIKSKDFIVFAELRLIGAKERSDSMADLKPCPFCGGEVKGYLDNHKKAMIECENCNMYFGVKLEIGCELVEGWKATFDSKEELFEALRKMII